MVAEMRAGGAYAHASIMIATLSGTAHAERQVRASSDTQGQPDTP